MAKNGPKMAKNGPIVFFINSQNFGKIGQKWPILGPKKGIFRDFRACRLKKKFPRNFNSIYLFSAYSDITIVVILLM